MYEGANNVDWVIQITFVPKTTKHTFCNCLVKQYQCLRQVCPIKGYETYHNAIQKTSKEVFFL